MCRMPLMICLVSSSKVLNRCKARAGEAARPGRKRRQSMAPDSSAKHTNVLTAAMARRIAMASR
jgi:hypothetical protein